MDTNFFAGIWIGSILSLLTVAIIKAIIPDESNNQPQAIDVYRGKTTLQITYKDSIPQDTVVVFK